MFNSRIASIIRKEFLQLFRDPRTLALAVVIPIVELFLLGYAATSDVRNIPCSLTKANRRNRVSCWMPSVLPIISPLITSSVPDEYQKLIESGDARVALVIPADYDIRLSEGNAKALMVLDG